MDQVTRDRPPVSLILMPEGRLQPALAGAAWTRQGRQIAAVDAQISAIACAHGLPRVTLDAADPDGL